MTGWLISLFPTPSTNPGCGLVVAPREAIGRADNRRFFFSSFRIRCYSAITRRVANFSHHSCEAPIYCRYLSKLFIVATARTLMCVFECRARIFLWDVVVADGFCLSFSSCCARWKLEICFPTKMSECASIGLMCVVQGITVLLKDTALGIVLYFVVSSLKPNFSVALWNMLPYELSKPPKR